MRKIITDIDHDEEIVKISLWKRLLLILFFYLRLVLHDLHKVLSNILERDKRKVLLNEIKSFLELFYKRIMQEGILKEAAALTYITILGFIPFLVLIVFLVPRITTLAANPRFQLHLYENFLPVSTGEIGNVITQLINREVTFNIFSLIVTLITSYSLFKVIRDTFDRILALDYQPPKDFLSQLLKFFGTIIFGFIIILLLFSSSSLPIFSSLINFPLFRRQLIYILPFLLQFFGLVFLYMILPSIKVKRKSLFRAAFWTTLIWVIVKSGFDLYVYNLTNVEAMYGVVKSLPIFLFWIYLNWVIILAGMVLVTIIEHNDKPLKKVADRHYVRVTLEMYTNKKMDKKLDAILKKDNIPELLDSLKEDEEI